MAARRLVLCPACERPQFQQATCVACGGPLPETAATAAQVKSARDGVLEAYDPFLEASFGRGRRLLLSQRRLEWHPGVGPALQVELSSLRSVTLERRPPYEALLFAVALGAVAARLPWPVARAALFALAALFLVACLAQRRFALVLESGQGLARRVLLGVGTRRAPISLTVESVWTTFAEELERLGVRVAR